MSEAGMLVTSEPMPIKVTMSAASATEPPSWRTVSAMTGRIAPSPRPNRNDGPNAGTAILRSVKASAVAALSSLAAGLSRRQKDIERRNLMARSSLRAPTARDSSGIDAALLILRLALGILILLHGIGKLPPPPTFIAAELAKMN